MDLPLTADAAIEGAVVFSGLDLGDILAESDLKSSVHMTGKMTGRLPFTLNGERVLIHDGALKADGPGHISIAPMAPTDLKGGGVLLSYDKGKPVRGGSLNDPSGFYNQALSDITYDVMTARISTLADGRIDPVFHFKGRFDPPHSTKTRIPIVDLITGRWKDRPIDLPSGTPVDLTFEVPFDLNGLLNDLARTNTMIRSEP